MGFVRVLVLLLLVAAGVSFALFAFTGEQKYKRFGLALFKWTMLAVLLLFAAIFADRLSS
ncbi:hypothetical protein [Ramlibacter alkalitolerans]|uniref:DUF1328 domain-containing protein n=1 Tax=Ramlibacter alkalitolerans TaxID=2039631 RepID=A0ABS1JHL6_9BURK|nr:hypothetical protein [Ramlibacter alkalitolerans]MBL0423715.1 hypothetical protein [Ramlibacter alkalitolerans]